MEESRLKTLSDREIIEGCFKNLPDYYDGRVTIYGAEQECECLVHECHERAADYCFVGSGLSVIIFPACAQHMKTMHGQVVEGLGLDPKKIGIEKDEEDEHEFV